MVEELMSSRMKRFLAKPPRRISANAVRQRKSRSARRFGGLPSLVRQQGGECYYCGHAIAVSDFPKAHERLATVDHYVALARGGKDDRSNCVAACFECNQLKAARDADEFRAASGMSLRENRRFEAEGWQPGGEARRP